MRKKQRIQKEGFKETNDKEKEGKFRDSRRATLRRSPSKVQNCTESEMSERMLFGRKRKLSSGPSSRNYRVLQGRSMRGVAHDKTRCILDLGVELQSLRSVFFFFSFLLSSRFLFQSGFTVEHRPPLLSLRFLSYGVEAFRSLKKLFESIRFYRSQNIKE